MTNLELLLTGYVAADLYRKVRSAWKVRDYWPSRIHADVYDIHAAFSEGGAPKVVEKIHGKDATWYDDEGGHSNGYRLTTRSHGRKDCATYAPGPWQEATDVQWEKDDA